MNTKTFCASLLLFGCVGTALADTPIYKWVDAQGQVHYSTEPHSDKAQQLGIQNTATSHAGTDVAPAASTAPSDTALTTPTPTDPPACKFGRDRLAKYLHAGTLYTKDDKGNDVALSAADQKKAVADAREYVKQTCRSGT
jgi:uncharacterized protein DUF4124